MKNTFFLFIIMAFLSLNHRAQTDSLDVKKWQREQSFYVGVLDPSFIASIGYSFKLMQKNPLFL